MSARAPAVDGMKGAAAGATRRGLLAATAGLLVSACARGPGAAADAASDAAAAGGQARQRSEPFYGAHQGGILTPAQTHTYVAAFDLVTAQRAEVVALFRRWTEAAARMCAGLPSGPLVAEAEAESEASSAPAAPAAPGAYGASKADSGDVVGLPPCRLTITFGFGAGLFVKEGTDRYGLAAQRPAALVDMPSFPGDQLVEARSGGDLSLQACADDAQVAFHAVRQLARLAEGVAALRWVQAGFVADFGAGATPRNLMGFKDGTDNIRAEDTTDMNSYVWVQPADNPMWMTGGTYLIARRIKILFDVWDSTTLEDQQRTIGRDKLTGAPLGSNSEFDPVELSATATDGELLIPANAHIRLASPHNNRGERILRRGYSYSEPVEPGSGQIDAGLFFIAFQRSPERQFVPLQRRLAASDALNQHTLHTSSSMFACPPGVSPGGFIGDVLFT
jgi:deferrochelatase/peroxidase EfeB